MSYFVVVFGFYVPPTAKVILRRGLRLKSSAKCWRSLESSPRQLVYKANSFTTIPLRLLCHILYCLFCCLLQNEPCREKTNILVTDLVQHKPGCTATEDG